LDFSCFGYHPDVESRLTFYEKWILALQLPFCFEVSSLSDRLMSSTPE
jgi:hypothetical protein